MDREIATLSPRAERRYVATCSVALIEKVRSYRSQFPPECRIGLFVGGNRIEGLAREEHNNVMSRPTCPRSWINNHPVQEKMYYSIVDTQDRRLQGRLLIVFPYSHRGSSSKTVETNETYMSCKSLTLVALQVLRSIRKRPPGVIGLNPVNP